MKQRLRMPRFRTLGFAGTLRVFAFFSAVGAVSLLLSLKTAHAEIEKRTKELGHKLLTQLGPLVLEEPTSVRINGQPMFAASTLTPLPPREVLTRFESHCREQAASLRQAFSNLPREVKGKMLPEQMRDPARWLTHRQGTKEGDLGEITCFTRQDSVTAQGFLERVARFAETGDVAELGQMRYVVARRVNDRATHVLAIWTEGSFNVLKMFPDRGDAPGSDSVNVPRPPEATRQLSAQVGDQPYSARIYATQRDPAQVLAFYDAHMPQRGFAPAPVWKERLSDKGLTATPTYARAYLRGSVVIVVSALTEPMFKEETQVGIAEIGSAGVMRAVAGVSIP